MTVFNFESIETAIGPVVAVLSAAIPGASADAKIELVANVLGIAGFVMSLALMILTPIVRRGRNRPATLGDLDRLSSAVVDMIGDRIVDQLTRSAALPIAQAPRLLTGQLGPTEDRVRTDLLAAVNAVAKSGSAQAQLAASRLLEGDTRLAEAFLAEEADRLISKGEFRAASEALHLKAALHSLRDTSSALHSCRRAVTLDPTDALGWSRLGHLYLRNGEIDRARAAFERATSLQTGYSQPARAA